MQVPQPVKSIFAEVATACELRNQVVTNPPTIMLARKTFIGCPPSLLQRRPALRIPSGARTRQPRLSARRHVLSNGKRKNINDTSDLRYAKILAVHALRIGREPAHAHVLEHALA
jgi:hypothetical protein